MATYKEAEDSILALIKTAWDTTSYPMLWEGVGSDDIPISKSPWARTTLRLSTGRQSTLSDESSNKRFERTGFVTVQVFTPIGKGKGTGLTLAKILADAMEGKTTPVGVWFQNVRINEIGIDGDWYQINFISDFIYDEIK